MSAESENVVVPEVEASDKVEVNESGDVAAVVPETVDPIKDGEKFRTLLGEGRRALIGGEKELAVDKLSDACTLGAKLFGETSVELFDAYLNYGQAQTEYALQISQIVKQNVEDEAESSDEEEEEGEKGGENAEDVGEEKSEVVENGEEKQGETGLTQEIADTTITPEGAEVDENDDQIDPVEDMIKGAWEVLNLALNIAEKTRESKAGTEEEKTWKENIGETHLFISHLFVFDDEYDKALEELSQALLNKSDALPAHSRKLADVHYHVGRTYYMKEDFPAAVESFTKAIEVLNKAIENIKETRTDENDNAEIDEINSTITEIQKEIEVSNSQEVLGNELKETLKTRILGSLPLKKDEVAKEEQINDITSLIRKRRKPAEDDAQTSESPSKTVEKKPRQDEQEPTE